jgi:hypothetical protein
MTDRDVRGTQVQVDDPAADVSEGAENEAPPVRLRNPPSDTHAVTTGS